MKNNTKTTFPSWFNANKPPELPVAARKAIEKYESQMGQWKYLVEQWNIVEREKRRTQYEKLKAEFENTTD
jgi:hypothetical protein